LLHQILSLARLPISPPWLLNLLLWRRSVTDALYRARSSPQSPSR